MGQIVAFDTNVFIYWLDSGSPLFRQSVSALELLKSPGVSAVTSVLTITELLAGLRSSAGQSVSDILDDFGDKLGVMPIDKSIAELAGELRQKFKNLRTPDALHIATALNAGAKTFITNDYGLSKLSFGIDIMLLEEL